MLFLEYPRKRCMTGDGWVECGVWNLNNELNKCQRGIFVYCVWYFIFQTNIKIPVSAHKEMKAIILMSRTVSRKLPIALNEESEITEQLLKHHPSHILRTLDASTHSCTHSLPQPHQLWNRASERCTSCFHKPSPLCSIINRLSLS